MSTERTTDDLVGRLWAVHEIRQLAYRYALAVDFRDREELLSLWDETETPARFPDIDVHTVRANIERWFDKGPSVLFVGNHVIDFDDDEHARGSVYCLAQVDFGDAFVDQSILYRDRYVRRGGRWLFVTRRHLLWFGQERERNPIRQPPANWPQSQVGSGTLPRDLER